MTAQKLLTDLQGLGVKLQIDGNRLRYAPRSALSRDLLERLKLHKAEVLVVLEAMSRDAGDVDPQDINPCSRCGRLEQWQSLSGNWRCLHCEPMAATYRLLAHVRRICGR